MAETIQKHSSSIISPLKIFTCFCFSLLITLFILFLSSSFLLYILHKNNILDFQFQNSPKKHVLLVPKGKILHQLHKFTFRNHSLYRYDDDEFVILNEHEDFEDIVSVESLEYNNIEDVHEQVIVMTSSNVNEDEYSKFQMNCQGTCECYVEENNDHRRSFSQIVYSHRYFSVIVVSVLSFAAAKFVDRHIDECYNQAKSVLGYSNKNIVCAITLEDLECEGEPELVEDTEEHVLEYEPIYSSRKPRYFDCNGNCVSKRIKQKNLGKNQKAAVFNAIRQSKCEEVYGGLRRLIITQDDHVMGFFMGSGQYHARLKYRRLVLIPKCKSFATNFLYNDKEGVEREMTIIPCGSFPKEDGYDNIAPNINCKPIGEDREYSWDRN